MTRNYNKESNLPSFFFLISPFSTPQYCQITRYCMAHTNNGPIAWRFKSAHFKVKTQYTDIINTQLHTDFIDSVRLIFSISSCHQKNPLNYYLLIRSHQTFNYNKNSGRLSVVFFFSRNFCRSRRRQRQTPSQEEFVDFDKKDDLTASTSKSCSVH